MPRYDDFYDFYNSDDDDDEEDEYYESGSDMTIDIDSDDDDHTEQDTKESAPNDSDQEEQMDDDNDHQPSDNQSHHDNPSSVNQPVNAVPLASNENQSQTSKEVVVSQTKKEISMISSTQVDSENCCIICTEMWTNSDAHHVVSLKCGHLFGKSCIETWLAPGRDTHRCPQCNKPAKRRDIHKIYARCLKPLDTWERDEVFAKAKVWESKVKILQEELDKSEAKYKILSKENERLRSELMSNALKNNNRPSTSINTNISNRILSQNGQFNVAHFKNIDVREGGCRLHCYSKIVESFAISVPNPNQNNTVFPKYGLKKVPFAGNKSECVFIHNQPIKDMAINQYDGTITTVSFDKTLKITSLISKAVISSVNLTTDPWSVHLNSSRPNLLYTGLRNGEVVLYDKRMLNQSMMLLSTSAKSPVVSLTSIEYENNSGKHSALMSIQLDTCSVFNFTNSCDPAQSDYKVSKLPFEGNFFSSHFDPKSGLSLLSCRPSKKHKKVTHYVFDFQSNDERSQLSQPNIVTILEGGHEQVHLSRSKVYTNPQNEECVLVCAGDESTRGAILWDSKSSHSQNVKTGQTVLDIELIDNQSYGSNPFVSCLSENVVRLYKFY